MRAFLIAFTGCTLLGIFAAIAPRAAPSAPPKDTPHSTSTIHVPDPVAPSPTPPPAPVPGTPTKLGAAMFYVVDADVACIVLTSPGGFVNVVAETGPIKMRGIFVDSGGKVETRTYARPFIYTLEAAGSGRVELLVVPSGATSEKEVIRRLIDVDNGTPAPPIPVPPTPIPPSPTDPFVQALAAAYAQETDATKAGQVGILIGLYRYAAANTVNDQTLKTWGDLLTALAAARKALMPDTALVKVRRAIGDQLNKDLPGTAGAPIDRAVATKAFNHVADVLGGLK